MENARVSVTMHKNHISSMSGTGKISTVVDMVYRIADYHGTNYSDDDKVKGDIRVLCSGATGLFVHEMQLQRLDDMYNQAVAAVPIIGPRFMLSLLRQKAKILKADISSLPSDDDLAAMEKAPPAPAAGGELPMQGEESGNNTPGTPATSAAQPGARPEAPEVVAPIQQ